MGQTCYPSKSWVLKTLDNTVSNISIFNIKNSEFPTKS